jgi:hypothetical protein
MLGTVKSRKRDLDGNPVGIANQNPILDTHECEVEFPDGSVDVLSVNMIAEAMYAQIDEEGRSYAIVSEILNHQKDGTATTMDMARIPRTSKLCCTTKGWWLLVGWKDSSSDWLLSYLSAK